MAHPHVARFESDALGERGAERRAGVGGIRVAKRLAVVLASTGTAIALTRESDWYPWWLFAGLTSAAVLADFFVVPIAREFSVTAALVPLVVAALFLGPLPAVTIVFVSSIGDRARRPLALHLLLGNIASYSCVGVVVGVVGRGLDLGATPGVSVFIESAGIYVAASAVTLVSASLNVRADWTRAFRSTLPLVPSEALLAVATGVASLFYRDGEYEALVALGAVGLLFNYFAGMLVRARRAADEMTWLAEQEARLTARLADAQSIARRDLADALHSGPLQTLLSVRQDLAEQNIARARRAVTSSLEELRHVMADLHIPHLPGNPEASLDGLARALGERHGITIELWLELNDAGDDSRRARLAFDAAQELIRNAAKHARATTIRCSMHVADGAIVVVVADDGVGLDASRLDHAVSRGHVGLAALRARAVDEGGSLRIAHGGERGTVVRLELPVDR
jgi:signal transduction histidine kinase